MSLLRSWLLAHNARITVKMKPKTARGRVLRATTVGGRLDVVDGHPTIVGSTGAQLALVGGQVVGRRTGPVGDVVEVVSVRSGKPWRPRRRRTDDEEE